MCRIRSAIEQCSLKDALQGIAVQKRAGVCRADGTDFMSDPGRISTQRRHHAGEFRCILCGHDPLTPTFMEAIQAAQDSSEQRPPPHADAAGLQQFMLRLQELQQDSCTTLYDTHVACSVLQLSASCCSAGTRFSAMLLLSSMIGGSRNQCFSSAAL